MMSRSDIKACLRFLLLAGLCLQLGSAWAVVDLREFDNETDRKRYQSFIEDMRCPKCQNQNLAGSNSPIAEDLRDQIYRMIQDDRSDKEIVDYMVERYGEYVLYKPRLSPATLVLWMGPPLLLLVGLITLIWIVRRRRREQLLGAADNDLSADQREHLDQLLSERPNHDQETPNR